ncbi:hypothetical protein LTR66_001476 [Elasticomyces elasticus]|nr:hypothetical protein LTR66_001476 [Elasticomyces elasticus]
MEANVKQHHAFLDGLERLHDYIKAYRAGKEQYDGMRIVALIDEFGPILRQHLADEIETLLGLREYGEARMQQMYKKLEKEGQKITASPQVGQIASSQHIRSDAPSVKKIGKTYQRHSGVPIVLSSHDRTFEDGLWEGGNM